MDFAKLEHLNNSQIQHLLSNLFKTHDIAHPQEQFFDLSTSLLTPEGINHINRILNEAVEYYQHYLLRTIGDSFVQKWNKKKTGKAEIALKTTQDVIDFFQQSSSQKNTTAYRQIHCSLLKIAFCMNDYAMHEDKLAEAENTFHTIKHDAIYPHFYDHRNQRLTKDVPEDANNEYMLLRTDAAVSGKRAISFKNSGRVKKKNKMMLKMIENPKYNDILRPKDLYGLRNEVSTPEDALFLLEYFWVHVFDRQGDIVNKKMFGATPEINLAFLERYRDSLDTDFYDYLHGVFSADSERAAPTGKNNKKYQEIKIIGHIAGYPYPIETQINLVNNKNESGYAHHTIYDAKAKIRAMVRLQSYIPESIIYRYINEAIQTEMSEAIHAGKSSQLLGL